MGSVFFSGFAVSIGLIVAIGAQNAHVLRQGLRREHVGLTVAVCALCDALLIVMGILGLGGLIAAHPDWLAAARYGGATFLVWYGLRALRAAFRHDALRVDGAGAAALTRRQALLTVAAFSLLNPHVYLDTVVLIGSIGGQQPEMLRPVFAAGAISASLVWFTALGYGARSLAPLFAQPLAWRVLDGFVAAVLWSVALMLILH